MQQLTNVRRVFVLALAGSGLLAGRAARAQAKVDEADETAVALGYRHDSTKVDAKKYPQHLCMITLGFALGLRPSSLRALHKVDILLVNEGEASHPLVAVKASWPQGRLIASEALPGWSLRIEGQTATYRPASDGPPANASGEQRRIIIPTLPPGAQRSIGWLRFDQPASVHVQIER